MWRLSKGLGVRERLLRVYLFFWTDPKKFWIYWLRLSALSIRIKDHSLVLSPQQMFP